MNLKLEILRILDGDGEKRPAYPEPSLLNELRMTLPGTILTAQFDSAIRELQDKKFIVGATPELGGKPKWKLTDDGKLALDSALSGT